MKVGKHANTGLYELFLENEHKARLLNFATDMNLSAPQLMIQLVPFIFFFGLKISFFPNVEIGNRVLQK